MNKLDKFGIIIGLENNIFAGRLKIAEREKKEEKKRRKELERQKKLEEDLDIALKSLGNMHDDEERAREQLEEIENFLQESKNKMREFKLPVITDNYFIVKWLNCINL